MLFKKIILILLVLCCLNTVWADDADMRGIYVSLAAGRGYPNYTAQNFFDTTLHHNADWVFNLRGALGFSIDNYFGVEAGYQHFMPQTFSDLHNTKWNGAVNESAIDILTVLRVPLFSSLYAFGKLGPTLLTVDRVLSAGGGNQATKPPIFGEIDAWEPCYAVGIESAIDKDSSLSGALQYMIIPADRDKNIPDTETYTVALIFHF